MSACRAALTRPAAIAAVLAVAAAAVRLPGVWGASLSQDEVASARILREPALPAVLHRIVRTESTPPLWYVLGWLAHRAAVPIVDVRLLSVLFGALLAAGVFALAATLVPTAWAAAASALVVVGYEPAIHGAELRAYELLALLALVLAALLSLELRRPGLRVEAALAASVAAGLLTHYFFALSLAAAVAWLWLDPRARAVRRRATVAVAIGVAVTSPWLPAFAAQVRHDRYWWIGAFDARAVVATPLRLFTPFGRHHLVLAAIVCLLLAGGAVRLARRSATGALVAVLAGGPLVAAAVLWAIGMRIYASRNLIELAPFAAIAGTAALASLPRRIAPVAAAVALAGVGGAWWWQLGFPAPAYGNVARTLVAEGWQPRDPIAVYGNFFDARAPLEWYLPHGPILDVSRATSACASVFVIGDRRVARLLPRRDVLTSRRAAGFTVTRLASVAIGRFRVFDGSTLLTASSAAPDCVRLSANPRFAPLT